MSYDKYKRGREQFNGSHQRITSKENWLILILRLTQSNQWIEVDHATRILSLNCSPMTSSVDKNKMRVMVTMMI